MRRVGPGLLIVLLALGSGARADEAPKQPARSSQELLEMFLRAQPREAAVFERALRKRGDKVVKLLRAARAKAESVSARTRLDRLLGRIEEDYHRARRPLGMVYVPAGPLELPRAKAPWGPSGKRVQVKAFYIDRREVTVGAWRRWYDALEAKKPGLPRRLGMRRPSDTTRSDLPAANLSWDQAVRFAKEVRGGRLPTAEEFERALRGSSLATYPWGERMRERHANLRDFGPGKTVPVGSYPRGAGPTGVQDLVGNVAEWTSTVVRQGRSGRYYAVVGGSYANRPDPALTWRGVVRMHARMDRDDRSATVGFRVVQDVPALP